MVENKIELMRKLRIGIVKLTPEWQSFLDMTGFIFEEFNPSGSDILNNYSAIIINQKIDSDLSMILKEYVGNGGLTLEIPGISFQFEKSSYLKKSIRFLFNENESKFGYPKFIELNDKASLLKTNNVLNGLIGIKQSGEGYSSFFGYDSSRICSNLEFKRKRFLFDDGRNPDELVSSTDKGKIAGAFVALLREMHTNVNLPLITKWNSPDVNPVFTFRIDSDFGTKESIKEIYELGQKYEIPVTWFLHVKAHEEWLDYFKSFDKQEIALHGYEHGTSTSTYQLYDNIERGLQLMADHDLHPNGFCAPYGIYSDSLATVLEKFNFKYTSEFTFAYDSNPVHPVIKGKTSKQLQIPIHPICTGSLSRKRVSVGEMNIYFKHIIESKISDYNPVMLYHHPMQKGLELFDDIFNQVRKKELCTLSYMDFTDFWNKRNDINPEIIFNEEEQSVTIHSDDDLFYQIKSDQQGFDLIKSGKTKLDQLNTKFRYSDSNKIKKEQIDALYADSLSLIKTSLLDWKNRIKL